MVHAVDALDNAFSHSASQLVSLSFSHLSPEPQATPITGIRKEGRRIGTHFKNVML